MSFVILEKINNMLKQQNEKNTINEFNSIDATKMNISALAYIGDAVQELYVRSHVMIMGKFYADALHKESIKYVSANGQSLAVKTMSEGFLTESEIAFIRKAKNKKIASRPKNVTPINYKWATAFEALIGFLHVSGEDDRVKQIISEAIKIVDSHSDI